MRDFPDRPLPPLKIAISECLLGREVRYDGSDAATSFPQRALEDVFTYVPICPEVGIGLGVPRDPIRLIGDPRQPSVVFVNPDVDDDFINDFVRNASTNVETKAAGPGFFSIRGMLNKVIDHAAEKAKEVRALAAG